MATERQLKQINRMREISVRLMTERREARFDEFLFLVQSGDSAEQAATRLGTNPLALVRQAYRYNRTDIVRYLSSAAYRQRWGR